MTGGPRAGWEQRALTNMKSRYREGGGSRQTEREQRRGKQPRNSGDSEHQGPPTDDFTVSSVKKTSNENKGCGGKQTSNQPSCKVDEPVH